MKKIKDLVDNGVAFVDNVRGELKKSTWPTRSELIESTVVVIVSVVLLGAFVGLSDKILEITVGLIVK